MELGEKHLMLVAHMRGESKEGGKELEGRKGLERREERLDFRSKQIAMNVNYIGEVTLTDRFSNNIVHFSFGIADCGKIRNGISGQYNSFRPVFNVTPLSRG